jgi:phage-related protein
LQRGDEPDDWKPFEEIGAGTKEIRLKIADGAFRIFYVVKFPEAIYVLHCFKKKSAQTSAHDKELAKQRYRSIVQERSKL